MIDLKNKTNGSRILKRIKYAISILFFTLFLCGSFVGFILSTEFGRMSMVDFAVTKINQNDTGLSVELSPLKTPHLNHWYIDSVTIKKFDKPWVQANGITLDWRWTSLLKRFMDVQRLDVDQIYVYPLSPDTSNENQMSRTDEKNSSRQYSTQYLSYASSIPDFNVETLNASSITFVGGGGLAEESDAAFSFQADAGKKSKSWFKLNALVKSIGKDNTVIELKTVQENDRKVVISGSLNAREDGVISRLLYLPAGQPLRAGFDLQIEEMNDDFKVSLIKLTTPVSDSYVDLSGSLLVNKALGRLSSIDLLLEVDDTVHSVAGTLEKDAIDLTVDVNALPASVFKPWLTGIESGEVSAEVRISNTVEKAIIKGEVQSKAIYASTSFEFASVFNLSENLLTYTDTVLTLGEGKIGAQGKMDLATFNTDMNLSVQRFDTRVLQSFVHLPGWDQVNLLVDGQSQITGSLLDPKGQASFKAVGTFMDKPVDVETELNRASNAIDIETLSMSYSQGHLEAAGTIDPYSLESKLAFSSEDFPLDILKEFGVAIPEALSARVSSNIKVSGKLIKPALQGEVTVYGHVTDVPFRAVIDGAFMDEVLSLNRADVYAFQKKALGLKAQYTKGSIDLHILAERFPVELLNALEIPIKPGAFSSELSVVGALSEPVVKGQLEFKTSIHRDGARGAASVSPLNWTVLLDTQNALLMVDAKFSDETSSLGHLRFEFPVERYVNYFSNKGGLASDRSFPLLFSVDGDFDLRNIGAFWDLGAHKIAGRIQPQLRVDGAVDAPSWHGSVFVDDGRYENPFLGLTVSDVHCNLMFVQDRFNVDECLASDGASGKYEIKGEMALPRGDDHFGKLDYALSLDEVLLVDRPELEAYGTGALSLMGSFEKMLLAGDIELPKLEASIDSNFSSGIPEIQVKELLSYSDKEVSSVSSSTGPIINLDISARADKKAFLRGRGLNAELEGVVRLRGTVASPNYDGTLKTKRGDFDIFGKKFVVTDGEVQFVNAATHLSVKGEYARQGQQVEVEVTGPADDLSILLSANPPMAEDEILSYIIFGKSTLNISPFQALQLATAVQQLRGGFSFDPIGALRDFLDVDNISIDSASNDEGNQGVNVGVGKYLNERVYLEVQNTQDSSQPWRGNIEVELSPSLNLESSTGGENGIEGVELKWKRDY